MQGEVKIVRDDEQVRLVVRKLRITVRARDALMHRLEVANGSAAEPVVLRLVLSACCTLRRSKFALPAWTLQFDEDVGVLGRGDQATVA